MHNAPLLSQKGLRRHQPQVCPHWPGQRSSMGLFQNTMPIPPPPLGKKSRGRGLFPVQASFHPGIVESDTWYHNVAAVPGKAFFTLGPNLGLTPLQSSLWLRTSGDPCVLQIPFALCNPEYKHPWAGFGPSINQLPGCHHHPHYAGRMEGTDRHRGG